MSDEKKYPCSDCKYCNGKGGRWDDESIDQWYWCEHCDAAEEYYAFLCKEQQRKEKRLSDEPTAGYYFASPRDDDDCLDGLTYEIVYLYFDGKWSVVRAGMSGHEPVEQWNLLRKIGSPNDH